MRSLEILALGAGVQSTALLLLNAEGRIQPPAEVAIFADTGGEMPETYLHLRRLASLSTIPICVVRRNPSLEKWNEHYCVLPARNGDSLLPRRCTTSWKAEPIERQARSMGAARLITQLGISVDEVHRMKESPKAWVTRRWPLVEMGWTREDCRRYLTRHGLDAPRSACFFCPLRPRSWWRYLAANRPALFDRACILEERLPSKAGFRPYLLSGFGRPLRMAVSDAQLPMLPDGQEGVECDGYCFV